MPFIQTAHLSILEGLSVVTLPVGTADASFPLSRVYDRDIGLLFKTTSSGNATIKIDQGASNIQAIDSMIIPAAHTLDGGTLALYYSDTDSGYTAAITPTVISGTDLINMSFTTQTKRWWKLELTSLTQIPSFAELFLTSFYVWARNPARPAGALDIRPNLLNVVTPGGKDRFIKRGPARKRKDYSLERISEEQRAELEALYLTYSDGKPFYIIDHESDIFLAKLISDLNIIEMAPGSYDARFSIIEVLP